MSEVEHRPTILMVGQGEPMQTALGEALRRHGMSVAACATAELEQAVRVYAPDLVLLIGDAAVRRGASVVRRMAANRATDVLPIAVVTSDSEVGDDGLQFRTGAVAMVSRGAGADAIARRVAQLSEEVPMRPGVMGGELNEHNLQDVVELVSSDAKTGILSIRSPAGTLEGMPMVVETEGASAHNMERVLERLKEAMASSTPLEYEFHETSGGRLSTLPGTIEPDDVELSDLRGSRVVILDSDELRAEKLAQVLIQRGVQIAAADFSTAVIPRIREIDPQVVVLDSSAVGGQGIDFVRAMRKDPQLRWASMLVVRWEDFWPSAADEAGPDIAQLATRIAPLIDQDLEVARRVEDEVDFDTRLELIGPGRLLRALGSMPGVRHVAVAGPKRSVEIDIADNSIVGAYATLQEGTKQTLQGMPALLALWGLNSGRVSVREQDLPSVANIMMPVDEALGVVSHELGFADGSNGAIEFNAETVPPAAAEPATVPPESESADLLDQAKTHAPPRFRHLQAAVGDSPRASFSEEETPTNKVQRMLGRMEPRRRTFPVARGAQEHAVGGHTDHAAKREKKSTQLGLAPAFEVLPEDLLDEQKTIPVGRKPTPPPVPPQSQTPAPAPLYRDDDFEPSLARALEGETMLAPAADSGSGMPAWLQGLLLVTLLAGVGVAGWLLWSRTGSDTHRIEASPEAEGAKGPITGTVNGLEPEAIEAAPEEAKEEPAAVQAEIEEAAPDTEPTAEAMLDEAPSEEPEAAVAEAPPEPEQPEAEAPAEPVEPSSEATKPPALAVPTKNLPRDPAKASDVLVHRALPMVRTGKLDVAEATLDRAWELDPRNPQAMAGYARLYIAKGDGEQAVVWAKKAVKKRARRASYHVLYGDALQLDGDLASARKAWRKALAIDPDNRAARTRLAKSKAQASK